MTKTSKDFEDVQDFADWIRSAGQMTSTETNGPVVETVYWIGHETFYTIVTDVWNGKLITVLEPDF